MEVITSIKEAKQIVKNWKSHNLSIRLCSNHGLFTRWAFKFSQKCQNTR